MPANHAYFTSINVSNYSSQALTWGPDPDSGINPSQPQDQFHICKPGGFHAIHSSEPLYSFSGLCSSMQFVLGTTLCPRTLASSPQHYPKHSVLPNPLVTVVLPHLKPCPITVWTAPAMWPHPRPLPSTEAPPSSRSLPPLGPSLTVLSLPPSLTLLSLCWTC